MNHYFECSIKYDKTQESGQLKKVTEKYLVEAINFTEAETRFIEKMTPYMSADYDIPSIKRINIDEIIESNDPAADRWYKSKLAFITLDEKTGAEKRTMQTVYIHAKNMDDARNKLREYMTYSLAYWEEAAVQETTIMDVFPYKTA